MAELKIIKLSDIKPMTDAEIKAWRIAERKAYLKMLRDICPSMEMRKQAKRLSKRKDSCEKCVYCDGETPYCWYPHSDGYIEDLNIDHCYEGVLRYLVQEAEKDNAVMTALMDCLADTADIAYENMKIMRSVLALILDETKKLNATIPFDEFKAFYDLYEALSIILPPLDE